MKLIETHIIWSNQHEAYIKLHKTAESDGTCVKWYTELNGSLNRIPFDDAMELLNQ